MKKQENLKNRSFWQDVKRFFEPYIVQKLFMEGFFKIILENTVIFLAIYFFQRIINSLQLGNYVNILDIYRLTILYT